MKKLIQLLTLTAIATMFALPAFAQTASSTPAAQGSEEERTKLYQVVIDNRKEHQDVACSAGRDYVSKYGTINDEYVAYVKKWVTSCDVAEQKQKAVLTSQKFDKLIADKNYTEAFPLGQQILSTSPNDLKILINTSWAAYNLVNANNHSNDAEAAAIAKRTIDSIQAGNTLEAGKPLPNKDVFLGWLNYELALINLNNKSDVDAAGYVIKAAQIESPLKKDPFTYGQLAAIYETQYKNLQSDYNARFEGKPETPESKAALAQVKQFIDPLIDAYARAVSYSGTDPKNQQNKAAWNARLKQLYEFRNGSATGVDAFVAGIQAKPIPAQPSNAPLPATPVAPAAGTTDSSTTPATETTAPVMPAQADTTKTPAQPSKTDAAPVKSATPATTKVAVPAGKAPSAKSKPRENHAPRP